uniref:Glycosyltransferase family 92 protein n=1 Tax=Caenorhabditis japonica TaxID=281687 RepID=A0A8R1DNG9_CAEJA
MRRQFAIFVWSAVVLVVFCKSKPKKVEVESEVESEEDTEEGNEDYEEICPYPWQTHDQNVLAQYSMCLDVVRDVCPYGASSYDLPSVLLCDPVEEKACPTDYTCEQAVNHQMLTTYNMHLCCKTTTLDSFENVFYETKVGINKMSSNISMPIFYVTSLSPSIIPIAPSGGIDYVVLNEYIPSKTKASTPEIRTGDHFAMLPYRFREPVYLKKVYLFHEPMPNFFFHVLVLFNPHGNPESMNLYYNRPSSLSREIDLSVPVWDEGVFFRNMNRVLTIQSDQTSSRQSW